jgi:predicted nucleic acid-binding protein
MASKSEFLLSEDFQDGQVIESVTIINPFLGQ